MRELDATPESTTIEIDGVTVEVSYSTGNWSNEVWATVRVPEKDIERLSKIPDLGGYRIKEIAVLDTNGEEVCSSYSLDGARFRLNLMRKEVKEAKQEQANRVIIEQFETKLHELRAQGLPIEQLSRLITELRLKAFGGRWHWQAATQSDVLTAIKAVEAEIKRLSGNPTEVIRDYFMAGKIDHRDLRHNSSVLAATVSWRIRTNGFFESPSEQELCGFYEERLRGIRTVRDLLSRDLRLDLEDYVPRAWMDDASLEPAPTHIELNTRTGKASYAVTYKYSEIDGKVRAVGVVRIPLSIFRHNLATRNKASSFPNLPYKIVLIIEVTHNDDDEHVIAHGPLNETLTAKVEKHSKSRGRGQSYGAIQGTPVPPWYVGPRPR